MRPSDAEIVRHHDDPPPEGRSPYVDGYRPPPFTVEIVEYDAAWPTAFQRLARLIRSVLDDVVVDLQHVGSTAVPGLPAKPIIDIDLTVPDPTREETYVPALESVAFRHVIREPWWHEHRVLKHDSPAAHLHVFGPDSPELVRHRMFRDWLVEHETDRATYAAAKRRAALESNRAEGTMQDYNALKEPVVREIYDRMFRAHGLL
jgi:GrpB-like predicted nucleotidyltransferase (UPF0157 family)